MLETSIPVRGGNEALSAGPSGNRHMGGGQVEAMIELTEDGTTFEPALEDVSLTLTPRRA